MASAAPIPSWPFGFATAFYAPSSLFSSMKMRIRPGPVTNGLENSPTGSKNLNHEVIATTLVIASTGAMLIVGHEAPCRFSGLSLPNQIPRLHIAKEGNSGQVSGTSDASKTQLGLIGTITGTNGKETVSSGTGVPITRHHVTQDSTRSLGPATTLNGRPKSASPEVFRVDTDGPKRKSAPVLEWLKLPERNRVSGQGEWV